MSAELQNIDTLPSKMLPKKKSSIVPVLSQKSELESKADEIGLDIKLETIEEIRQVKRGIDVENKAGGRRQGALSNPDPDPLP